MDEVQKTGGAVEIILQTVSKNRRSLPFVAILLGVLSVVFAVLFTQGFIVAATVDGSPISRLSVIQELEEKGGKTTLDELINKKSIDFALSKANIGVDESLIKERIAELETQVATQGGTLKEALAAEGMTLERLTEQITTTLKLEEMFKDKTVVTDEEVVEYLKTNEAELPKGVEVGVLKVQIKNQLQQEKFQAEAQKWVAEVTKNAKVKYYVAY